MRRFLQTLKSWAKVPDFNADEVVRLHEIFSKFSEKQLASMAGDVRDRLLLGASESSVANETFALVREATRRRLGIELRRNQLQTAWHLLNRQIVELPTGEGKSLAAIPALVLRALAGRGAWLATANDYLAKRDAVVMEEVFAVLGLSVGYLQSNQSLAERRNAYQFDVTYGTIREFGFDFLRDRLKLRRNRLTDDSNTPIQRDRFSIIVDEADSVLLDDALTPLIISEPKSRPQDVQLHQWAVSTGRRLRNDVDFLLDPMTAQIWLTESGRAQIRTAATVDILTHVNLPEAYEFVVRAIEAETTFHRDRDYVVRDNAIVIVDRMTGRLAEGRQWQNGLQQSLEAANQLPITPDTKPVARVAIQSFLRGFAHLSGMTGTAKEAAFEFRHLYGMREIVIPPFRPCRRIELPVQITNTRQEKWGMVIAATQELQRQGRPVLIGTRDLNASEELSETLRHAQVSHRILTAKQEADEAELISQAGEAGVVTVSTSIAGRGTDIRLGPGVADRGGLHVIATSLFDASRIDRQLAGRCGRQGDPASYQQILSLDDPLLHAAWDDRIREQKLRGVLTSSLSHRTSLFHAAQKVLEKRQAQARRALLANERERMIQNQELGFDPYLDDVDS